MTGPSIARSRLVRHRMSDGNTFYTPKGARMDVSKVAREVAEYFEAGIRLSPGDVVFDVGANVGLFARHVAEHTGGDASIYCFEPIGAIHDALAANFAEHPAMKRTRHRLFRCGLTKEGGPEQIQFYYFRNNPCDSTYDIEAKRRDFEDAFATFGGWTKSRIERALPGPLGRWLGSAAGAVIADLPKGPVGRWMSDRVTGMEKVVCELSTLTKIIEQERVPKIDLLKIDVEGAELDVLLGLSDDGWRKVRQIVLEGHDKEGRLNELVRLIESHGMKIGTIGKPADTEALGLANFMLTAARA
ncbi:MAG TPA: FkbM family methyltransferase [Sandaracinaceae bacterium]